MANFVHSLKPIELNFQVSSPKLEKIQESVKIEPVKIERLQREIEEVKIEEDSKEIPSTPSQNAIWGPPLWKVLHILAEQTGKSKLKVIQEDEVRRWIQMMRAVEHVMPCALCRGHYKEWLVKHSLNNLLALRGQAFREGARKYVWQLHENVNTSKNISSGISLSDCEAMYTSFETLQEALDKFSAYVQTQISAGRFKGEPLKEFRIQVTYLRKLTDSI
jgi:hypothetical protein